MNGNLKVIKLLLSDTNNVDQEDEDVSKKDVAVAENNNNNSNNKNNNKGKKKTKAKKSLCDYAFLNNNNQSALVIHLISLWILPHPYYLLLFFILIRI